MIFKKCYIFFNRHNTIKKKGKNKMKKLYYNCNIITMTNKNADAMIVEDDKIIDLGSYDNLKNKINDADKLNLNGKTLMPGFIDCHSHLSSVALSLLQLNLENARSFIDIINSIKSYIKTENLQESDWIQCIGYDHNLLKEKRHPTRQLLDEHFKNYPIVIQHVTGHFGVMNTKALQILNKDDQFLDGILYEKDFLDLIRLVPLPNIEKIHDAFKKAQKIYASYGITTAQEGLMVKEILPLYKSLIQNKILYLDVVGYVDIKDKDIIFSNMKDCDEKYFNHFKLKGYKIILDGSPQAQTAWMRKPYLNENNYGIHNYSHEEVKSFINEAIKNNKQLLTHANGDKAIDQFLSALEEFIPADVKKIHPVCIHAQFLQEDQIPIMKKYNVIPSFFIDHVYYYADIHIKNLGFERATQISPARSCINNNLIFTFHQDSPVVKPDMLHSIWCSVNRLTKDNVSLDQKITPYNALKAITINASYQYQEPLKGSIEIGNIADFIILDNNPLTVNPQNIKDIKILATFKNGKCIYSIN